MVQQGGRPHEKKKEQQNHNEQHPVCRMQQEDDRFFQAELLNCTKIAATYRRYKRTAG